MTIQYKKIPYATIETVITRYELSAEATSLSSVDALSPKAFVKLLQQKKLWNDLITFMAHALPLMDAIHWGWRSLSLRQQTWTEQERELSIQIKQWLENPDEPHRIHIQYLGEAIGTDSGMGWLSLAVFWSGTGSIVAPNLPTIFPPPFLYSKALSSAIITAAMVPEWDGYDAFMWDVYLLIE